MSARVALLRDYAEGHPDDVARRLEGEAAADVVHVLGELPDEVAVSLLCRMVPPRAAAGLQAMDGEQARRVIERLPIEIAASLLRRGDEASQERLLGALPRESADAIRRLLSFDPESTGAVMDPQPPVVSIDATAAEAREELSQQVPAGAAYVLDAEQRLVGVIDTAVLLRADPAADVRQLMSRQLTWLIASTTLESAFAHPGWRDHDALPVVDDARRLVGVLRHVRVRQLEAERATGDDPSGGIDTVIALGELYWLGLSGLLQGFATAAEPTVTDRKEDLHGAS